MRTLGCAICDFNAPKWSDEATQRPGSTQNTDKSMGPAQRAPTANNKDTVAMMVFRIEPLGSIDATCPAAHVNSRKSVVKEFARINCVETNNYQASEDRPPRGRP